MSLKIIHTKADGTKVPLKVSIWDAFKGVPDRKPRKTPPRKCPCCGKVHCATPKPSTKDGPKAKDSDKAKANNAGKKDDDGLTDDDRIILRMKGTDPSASWKDIMAATSTFKHLGEVKARFRDIKHHLDEQSKDVSDGNKKNGKTTAKEEIARLRKEEGLRRKAEKEAAREAESKAKKEEEEKAKEEAAKKEDDEKKSAKTGKARKDHDKNKGVALAAKHFDKTGIRITPREALKLAEGK
ncbi:hypothetical protein A1O7_06586 [Cladophialophora yegresii CBS 114405]|uniref:Uncharacterized protein n=1 Tax=Cladophialophora yegresii CBS 114405 TaxID=1182544 RepID=W9W2C8_9EURO|nr:uncharacterized protein A1O7_06586 [Cladophialophora yegresii CBS 114405]EXJ59155.1 hypothetical protein A1O7_06586 [Cladophialophora yegresii CBS 114405]